MVVAETEWQRDVRARLEAGETITGGQIRRELHRNVHVYEFLARLEHCEGWVFEKTLIVEKFTPQAVTQYRLVRKKRVRAPARPGPRNHLPVRPTDIAIERLLAGEELEGKAIARELKVTSSLLSYVKKRLEAQGYEFENRWMKHRMFTRIVNL